MPETPKNEHVSVELLRSWADDEVPWHDAAQIPRGIFVVAADEIERLRAENAALKAQLGPALVAHGSGFETSVHLLGALCSRCQPQIEITDSMVERAMDAFCGVDRGKGVDHWYCDPDERPSMRAALEAVLGGNEK